MMKRFIRIAILLCVATVLLSALSLNTLGAKAMASSWQVFQNRLSSTTCGTWNVVPSPNGSNGSGLSGVATVSAKDVWAVGGSGSQTSSGQTLIEHWNGTSWSIVTSPNPSSMYNHLNGVTAVSATDVWAVGYDVNTAGITQTLIERWNGTSWSVVKSPSPASGNNELFSIAAVSAKDIWTVGFISTNTADHTLIEHWNGTSWSVVKSPNPGSSSDHLTSVAAVSSKDVWAVGDSNTFGKTLVEHWNGVSWSVVKSPSLGTGGDLTGVTAVSASNIWAAGYTSTSSTIQTLIEHWNGMSWQVVKSVNFGKTPAFWAITAVSATDVWAVGSHGTSTEFDVPLTERWNGTNWRVVKSPSPGSFSTQLVGVAAISATDVWAVGHADNNSLTENFHC